jgi:hypothetical protein
MIVDDEILSDGEVIKLIAVISGGSCRYEECLLLLDFGDLKLNPWKTSDESI